MPTTQSSELPRFAKIILLIVLLYLFYVTIFRREHTFLGAIDLLFHEAGHLIFILFGEFISILGGTLTQLLIPGVIFINFLKRGEVFSSAIAVFWFGESLSNVAVYVKDASFLELDLIGGGVHDWVYILGRMGLINYAEFIGNTLFFFAALIMLGSILIGAWSIRNKMV